MSFCILTFIISPGVPKIPPQPPATAAIPSLIVNEIGSPFGDTFCFATWNIFIVNNLKSLVENQRKIMSFHERKIIFKWIITSYMANRVVEYVICLRREADSPLYKAKNPCDLTIWKIENLLIN